MPQVSRDLLVDLWYPGEIKPEPAEPASADGLLYMFLHRDAAGNTRGAIRHTDRETSRPTERWADPPLPPDASVELATGERTAEHQSVGEVTDIHEVT